MFRIAIVRKGQPADRRTGDVEAIKDAVYGALRRSNANVTSADNLGIDGLVAAACAMAEQDGFAALEFGETAVTVRPAPMTSTPS